MNNEQSVQNNNLEEDEIDLRELFNIIMKKKKFIFIFTSVLTILSIIYVLTKTPIYEAKALVEIGSYKVNNNNLLLDNTSQLVKKLNTLYIDMLKNEKNKLSEISKISVPKNSNEFIEISALAIDNNLAIDEINKIMKFIKNKHQIVLDEIIEAKKLQWNTINRNIIKYKNTTIRNLDLKISQEINATLKMINLNIENLKTLELNKLNEEIRFIKYTQKSSLEEKISNMKINIKNDKITLDNSYANLLKIKDDAILSTLRLSKIQFLENKIFLNENALIDLKNNLEKLIKQDLVTIENKKTKLLTIDIPALINKQKLVLDNIEMFKIKKENMLNIGLAELEEKKKILESSMLSHNYKNTQIIGKIIVNDYAVKPKKKLIVVVTFVSGFILAIFLVFFMNFIQGIKEDD